jgi:predicted nucleotidyltransferase
MFDWSQYTGQLKWLPERTIYLSRHGSHAYGTSLPTSDLDVRGIAVAPIHYYLGISETFEQAVQNQPIDLTIFDLLKFVKLAADANPNALEIIFTDPSDHLLVKPVMELLFQNREAFLSQKAKHTFSGYARAQLKRINAHYRWLKHQPKAPPTRGEFGLPERTVIPADQLAAAQAAISKQMDSWAWREMDDLDPSTRQSVQDEFTRRLLEITQWSWDDADAKIWQAAAGHVGLDQNFIRLLDLERQYTARLKEWQQYQDWKKNRNPARAALEEKFGYDCKHAMHLVRLTKMCRELLVDGVVQVRRPDAEELLEIRNGAWSYEDLVQYSDKQDAELSELVKTSRLPRQPDRKKLDELCLTIIQRMG